MFLNSHETDGKRRRAARIEVTLACKLAILIPENTFQPVSVAGIVKNIGTNGMMIHAELSHELYVELLKKPRYCRIILEDRTLPAKLTAKAVWIHPEKAKHFVSCRIGVFFQEVAPTEAEQLYRYLEEMQTSCECRIPNVHKDAVQCGELRAPREDAAQR